MATQWQLTGDYFENCNCNVVCPCLASPAAPLTSRPSEGACDVALIFHVDQGKYGALAIDGLNIAALGAIFTGAEGGPMAAFVPLIANQLGVKKVPIHYRIDGKARSVEIPGIMQIAVAPIPTMHPSGEIWANLGHPAAPDRLAL